MKISVRLAFLLLVTMLPILGCESKKSTAPEGEGMKSAADPMAAVSGAQDAVAKPMSGDAGAATPGAGGGATPGTP